jgi:hypothetical protein
MNRQIRRWALLLLIAHLLTDGAAEAVTHPSTQYAPRTYQCVRAFSAPLIDGLQDDPAWQNADWTEEFVDIEGSEDDAPSLGTRVKLLWNNDALFILAELEEPAIQASLTERDSVIFHENDFELFIDPDADNHNYAELEINALGTIWDLLLTRPYRDGGRAVNGWDMKGLQAAVSLDGTVNDASDEDEGWSVELAIPWAALAELSDAPVPPRPGDRWHMNFSRVQYSSQTEEGRHVRSTAADGSELPADNWVWSPQGVLAMHCPEMWGIVEFAGGIVLPGLPELNSEDYARQALMCLYYWQHDYHAEHGQFASEKIEHWYDDYPLPEVDSFRDWLVQDEMWASRDLFRFAMSNGLRTISIDERGQIRTVNRGLTEDLAIPQAASQPVEEISVVEEVAPEPVEETAADPAEDPVRSSPDGRNVPPEL